MTIDRGNWQARRQALPSWICPKCQAGTLLPFEGHPIVEESKFSQRAHKHPDWDPDWIERRFSAFLNCQNPKCGELVVASGSGFVDMGYYFDPQQGDVQEFYDELQIESVVPAPPIFLLHKEYPKNINELLRVAFRLFWADQGACAAKLRVAIEGFLHERDAKGSNLHKKIEYYRDNVDHDIGEMLMAIKWLGNTGSHLIEEGLATSDLLDAFEVFEYCLETTYLDRARKIKSLAAKLSGSFGKP